MICIYASVCVYVYECMYIIARNTVYTSVLARPNLQGGPPFLDLKFDFICNDPSFPETGKQFSPLVLAV